MKKYIIKKEMKILKKKMNSLIKGEMVPVFKFEGCPGSHF